MEKDGMEKEKNMIALFFGKERTTFKQLHVFSIPKNQNFITLRECFLSKSRYNDNLKFEGEYLDGERNGKGKEYDVDGKLKFEGEYFNGKIWNGKVKEYDYNNKNYFFKI